MIPVDLLLSKSIGILIYQWSMDLMMWSSQKKRGNTGPLKLTYTAAENRTNKPKGRDHLNQPQCFRGKLAVSFREGKEVVFLKLKWMKLTAAVLTKTRVYVREMTVETFLPFHQDQLTLVVQCNLAKLNVPKTNSLPLKIAGFPFWDGLFSWAILVLGRVGIVPKRTQQTTLSLAH